MLTVKGNKREKTGKKVSELRSEGILPGVLYGPKLKEAFSVAVDLREFEALWKKAGESTLIDLDIENKKRKVLIHGVDYDPISGRPIHVDFYEVDIDKPIRIHIPIIFEGESEVVKTEGGVLLRLVNEIEIEAVPDNLPHDVKIDVSLLKSFEDRIKVGDILFEGDVDIKSDLSQVIALVEPPRVQQQEEDLSEKPEIDFDKIEDSKSKEKEETEAVDEEGEEEKKKS